MTEKSFTERVVEQVNANGRHAVYADELLEKVNKELAAFAASCGDPHFICTFNKTYREIRLSYRGYNGKYTDVVYFRASYYRPGFIVYKAPALSDTNDEACTTDQLELLLNEARDCIVRFCKHNCINVLGTS